MRWASKGTTTTTIEVKFTTLNIFGTMLSALAVFGIVICCAQILERARGLLVLIPIVVLASPCHAHGEPSHPTMDHYYPTTQQAEHTYKNTEVVDIGIGGRQEQEIPLCHLRLEHHP